MDWIASQITSLSVVCSIVYSGVNQRKHQSSASLAFVREIHRGPVNFSAQMASYAENASIWWRHHELQCVRKGVTTVLHKAIDIVRLTGVLYLLKFHRSGGLIEKRPKLQRLKYIKLCNTASWIVVGVIGIYQWPNVALKQHIIINSSN